MKKIILLASMAIVIIAQCFVIGHFFVDKYDIILGGDTFKFLVTDMDLDNARKKGYIEINLVKNVEGIGNYGVLRIDENGFAELSSVALERPTFGAYIESGSEGKYKFPFDKYYIDQFIGKSKKAVLTKESVSYITVRIKEGKAELLKMLIDGEEVERYCAH